MAEYIERETAIRIIAKHGLPNGSFPGQRRIAMDEENVTTIDEAIKMLNEKHCHPSGFHLFFVRDEPIKDLWDENEHGRDAMAHLMRQTYDWRFGRPEQKEYTVTLSAADMEVVGAAMEVYTRAAFTRYLEPELGRIMEKLAAGGLGDG